MNMNNSTMLYSRVIFNLAIYAMLTEMQAKRDSYLQSYFFKSPLFFFFFFEVEGKGGQRWGKRSRSNQETGDGKKRGRGGRE